MRVLVVGGTGFLGPPVVARLSRLGHEVVVYHRGEHEADLPFGVRHVHSAEAAPPVVSFPGELTGIAWDVVLAMAPIGRRDAAALMAAFHGIARRVVALSSGDVYRAYGVFTGGEPGSPDPRPLAEDAPLRERLHPYRDAAGVPAHLAEYEKISVERAVLSDPGLPGTVLRLPAVYGPGDRQHRFGPAWRRIADGRMEIPMGRAQAGWRWTHGYVDDVADAVVLGVVKERAKGRIFNVGEDPTPTMAERVEAFGRALGWKGRVVAVDDACLPPHLRAAGNFSQDIAYDTARIRSDLDWTERAAPAEALRRTAAWEAAGGGGEEAPAPTADEYEAERRAVERAGEGAR